MTQVKLNVAAEGTRPVVPLVVFVIAIGPAGEVVNAEAPLGVIVNVIPLAAAYPSQPAVGDSVNAIRVVVEAMVWTALGVTASMAGWLETRVNVSDVARLDPTYIVVGAPVFVTHGTANCDVRALPPLDAA